MHFSDKLMDHKDKYTWNIRVSECSKYILQGIYAQFYGESLADMAT